jgi:hypothetical protein
VGAASSGPGVRQAAGAVCGVGCQASLIGAAPSSCFLVLPASATFPAPALPASTCATPRAPSPSLTHHSVDRIHASDTSTRLPATSRPAGDCSPTSHHRRFVQDLLANCPCADRYFQVFLVFPLATAHLPVNDTTTSIRVLNTPGSESPPSQSQSPIVQTQQLPNRTWPVYLVPYHPRPS